MKQISKISRTLKSYFDPELCQVFTGKYFPIKTFGRGVDASLQVSVYPKLAWVKTLLHPLPQLVSHIYPAAAASDTRKSILLYNEVAFESENKLQQLA